MKAIQFTEHGSYDVLKIVEIETPLLREGQLLVKVGYAAVNPVDNTLRKGGIKEPVKFPKTLGDEGSGVVIKGNSEYPQGTRRRCPDHRRQGRRCGDRYARRQHYRRRP